MSGWALVRRGGALRAPRRWVVLRSGSVLVLDGPDARTPSIVMPLNGASVVTNPAKLEAVVKSPDGGKVTFTWPTSDDLTAFKGAFDFANRVLDDRFKAVSHKVLTRRSDSEVVFGFDKATGEHVAIKVLSKDRQHSKTIAECEVAIRMSIDHRAIVKTVDVFETPFDLFIVMNYMDGASLASRIVSKTSHPISEHEARVIMARLFSALAYLHARGIVHRNVKPSNILLEHPGEPRWPDTTRLSDFRMACYLNPELAPSAEAADFANQVVGTPDFLAPEAAVMINQTDGTRRPCLGLETDMWAAGVTLYNILSQGHLPFAGATTPEVLRNARHSQVSFDNHEAFRLVSPAAVSLIRALLNPDRRKRPTAESVLYHPWFDNFDPHAPGPVMRDPPLVGYQKFRVVACSVRFLCRILGNTPGMATKFLLSARTMRFVTRIAPVDVRPAMLCTSSGVDIAPQSGPPHPQIPTVRVAGVEIAPSTIPAGISATNLHNATLSRANIGPGGGALVGVVGAGTGAVAVVGTNIPGNLAQQQGPASKVDPPFQFTTSTLSPTEGGVLRTSQTSSVGSLSFRSSHDSSRLAAQASAEFTPSPLQLHPQQAHSQTGRRFSSPEEQLRFQERQAAENIQLQQRLQQDQQRLQQEQQLQIAAEQQQHLLIAQQLQQQPVPVATPRGGAGGIIGGLLGAMRRDSSPHTSNPASRAHSLLASREGSNLGREHSALAAQAAAAAAAAGTTGPSAAVVGPGRAANIAAVAAGTAPLPTGERSQESTRSHMETCNLPRGETSAGDESMGSSSGSDECSNRSMLPLSDSRPGSDSLRAAATGSHGGGARGGGAGGTFGVPNVGRGSSAVELAELTPELALYDQTTASALAAADGSHMYAEYASLDNNNAQQGIRYHATHSGDRVAPTAQQTPVAVPQQAPPAPQQQGFLQRPFGSGSGSGSRGNSAMSDGTGGGSGVVAGEAGRQPSGSKKNKQPKRRMLPDLRGSKVGQFTGFGIYSDKAGRS